MIQLLSTKINYRSKNDENNLCGSHGFTENICQIQWFLWILLPGHIPQLENQSLGCFYFNAKKNVFEFAAFIKGGRVRCLQ